MTTITIHAPAKVAVPRGAPLAAALFGRVLSWFSSHADAHLERREYEERTTEANRVRVFAQSMLSQDPRFAADLFAAADRHERS